MKRSFIFKEGTSQKFWTIETKGDSFVVTYGRLGTDGQQNEKIFASDTTATIEAGKMVKSKLRKGYVEVEAGAEAEILPEKIEPVSIKLKDNSEFVYLDWKEFSLPFVIQAIEETYDIRFKKMYALEEGEKFPITRVDDEYEPFECDIDIYENEGESFEFYFGSNKIHIDTELFEEDIYQVIATIAKGLGPMYTAYIDEASLGWDHIGFAILSKEYASQLEQEIGKEFEKSYLTVEQAEKLNAEMFG